MMLVLATVLSAILPLAAATETVNGFSWEYEDEYSDYGEPTGGVVVSPTDRESISGNLVIPSRLGGKPVTSVGIWAFFECSGMTSITIPNSVTSIGFMAFYGCSGLTSITIPEGVTSIGSNAFADCSNLTSITIPNSMKSIGLAAFGCCKKLTSLAIPNSVTSIGGQAFYECLGLKNMTIPSSVTDIGESVFENCNNLESVTLPTWCKSSSKDWASYLRLQGTTKIIYKDVAVGGSSSGSSGGSSGGKVPEAWKKARMLSGAATRALPPPRDVQGIIALKCGKANKRGVAKVSAALTGLDGKKRSYKAQSVDVTGKTVTVNFGGLNVTIDGDYFEGGEDRAGGLSVRSTDVGGNWTGRNATVAVDATDFSMFAGTVLEAFLPDGEQATVKGGKWKFSKAAGVRWARPKRGAALPETYDAKSGKGLIVDTSAGKTNLSGLKLTYTPKTGLFKGSFKVYALEDLSSGKKKLKKYTANVTGVVVDGIGVGQATIKKPTAGPWLVTVE